MVNIKKTKSARVVVYSCIGSKTFFNQCTNQVKKYKKYWSPVWDHSYSQPWHHLEETSPGK